MEKNQFTDLWTMVREAVENGETMHESWVDDVFKPCILNLTSEKAKILYIDICKVQIAVYENKQPVGLAMLSDVLNWEDIKNVVRFHNIIIANGRIPELVADCIELPTKERQKRWVSDVNNQKLMITHHKENTDYLKRLSEFRIITRSTNQEAYDNLRERLAIVTPPPLADWTKVILWTPERLAQESRNFWRGLMVARCSNEEKCALIHKLTMCQSISACPTEIIRHRDTLSTEQFLEWQREQKKTQPRILRILTRLYNFVRRRV